MATIDRTRALFEPRKRYGGVRMQQGRVVLDDDYNEAFEIEAEHARRTAIDVIGPSGSPDAGFKIEGPSLSGGRVDFTIRAGTLYVGGIAVRLDHDSAFSAQPDWVGIANVDRTRTAALPADLVYAEVWQQPVSAEEDREIAEPALGGPDTTARVRTMARVRMRSVTDASCTGAWAELLAELTTSARGTWQADTCELHNDLRLRVDYDNTGVAEDLCSPSVTAGYLGAENQALRVQLIEPPLVGGSPQLCWGYDNGAPLYRARIVDNGELELLTLPRDDAHWPLLDQTIEVLPWSAVLVPDGDPSALNGEVLADGGGRALPSTAASQLSLGKGHLVKLASSYDAATHRITLADPLPASFNALGAAHLAADVQSDRDGDDRSDLVFVRVWNRGSDLGTAARISFVPGNPVTLGQTGIRVTVSGDDLGADAHWIIAARPNTPDQVYPWSFEDDEGRAPNGVRRFLVPLAVIAWTGTAGTVHDCRETFRPLTRIRSCCRYTIGDGEQSHGDFTSIQEAIDSLPASGGEICVLPGLYRETIKLHGKVDVTIHGCGPRSILSFDSPDLAVVLIRDSTRIALRDLAITSTGGWAIRADAEEGPVQDIELARLSITVRDRGALHAEGIEDLALLDSEIVGQTLLADPEQASEVGRLPLVQAQGERIELRGNTVRADPGDSPVRRVAGGVQIGGLSSDVVIARNRILGGNGHGITLGHVVTDLEQGFGFFFGGWFWYWDGNCLRLVWIGIGVDGDDVITVSSGGPLERVTIEHNEIADMAADGIGVPLFFDDTDGDDAPDDVITVRELRVIGNRMHGCNTGEREPVSDFVAQWSGHGPIALSDVEDGVIRDNELYDNGVAIGDPICGLFILNAEDVVIDRNRVSNNGRVGASYTGHLGGVVVPHIAPLYLLETKAYSGRPALRVADNQVAAPEGPALWLRASSGTIEAVDNDLHTTAARRAVFWGMVADVLNGGKVSELVSGKVGGAAGADTGGQIIYSRNNVSWAPASGEAPYGFTLTVLFTLDDLMASDNVMRADLSDGFWLTDLFAFGITVEIVANRLRETIGTVPFSIFSFGFVNNTTDNLCTHCVMVFDYALKLNGGATGWSQGLNNRSIVDDLLTEFQCPSFGRDDETNDINDLNVANDEAGYAMIVRGNS